MNASNPFQIPSCLQANLQLRRRERIKKSIIVVVTGTSVLLAVLLILGCNSEHARVASSATTSAGVLTEPIAANSTVTTVETKPVAIPNSSNPSPIVALTSAPIVSKAGASVPASLPSLVYVVKPADTLSRIAKLHGTTVSALKAVNGLNTDRIAIGMKLKLPEA